MNLARKSKLRLLIKFKKIRDEAIKENNYGRKKYLLFRLNVESITEHYNRYSIVITGGWTFSSDSLDNLILIAYRKSVEKLVSKMGGYQNDRKTN